MTSQGTHGIIYPRPGGLGPRTWSREETCAPDPKVIFYPLGLIRFPPKTTHGLLRVSLHYG